MKYVLTLLTTVILAFASHSSFAQATEKIKVSGECNTCKKKIEAAAKQAGASYAVWNKDTKELVFKYNSSATNTAKIEQAISGAGYDTPDYKASDDAYNNLDDCCKYDRTMMSADKKEAKTEASCMKDGKCVKDMTCCKEGAKKDCCKKG